jgi:glycerol uptake facilitator-like aquaporin
MARITQYLDWRTWLTGLWSATIRGAAGALIGTSGLLAGNLAGADVTPLDFKQVGGVFLGAGLAHFMFYLYTNPAPAKVAVTEETQPPFPPST